MKEKQEQGGAPGSHQHQSELTRERDSAASAGDKGEGPRQGEGEVAEGPVQKEGPVEEDLALPGAIVWLENGATVFP